MAAEPVHVLKALSVLLQYPGPEVREAAAEVEPGALEGATRRQSRRIAAFLGWFRSRPAAELERAYVETFDFGRRQSLHLTYHEHGDRRQRGLAMLRLKQAYASAGFEPSGTELPDYLPLMLEFAALGGEPGRSLLAGQRVSLELVRAAARDEQSPYAELLDAVADALPGLTRRQLARVRRLAAEGPPSEQVGLEPFAPPEVMPT
ncbi:MAG TPA: nitrate reductase molybdenum cofactor assembly chaperone [Solirubrobacterales bacterium]